MRHLLLILFCFFNISYASASTWNSFINVFTDNTLYFFDADTVVRQGDVVTIWEKTVNKKDFKNQDGSYAQASKTAYSCTKRNFQTLTWVTYDQEGNFIRTYPSPSSVFDIIPGSLGENILKTVCSPDFPKGKNKDLYFEVKDNDVFKFTTNYFEYIKQQTTDPAPK